MKKVLKYCTICLQTNLRPNSKFSKEGICSTCIYVKNVKNVDWEERFQILKKIIKLNKSNTYDCVLGVSGGKDSTRQALWLRDKLGVNPLLISLGYPPQQVTEKGVDNLSNLINLDFDMIVSTLSPKTWRRLFKQSFFKFANWSKSTELALHSCVPQIAMRYKIPLIFWGENPALQVGDLKTKTKKGYDGKNLKYMNTLDGGNISWLDKDYKKKLFPYIYPSDKEFEKNKTKIIYLGWFLRDWSLANNAKNSIVNGLKIREESFFKKGDLYGVTALDEDWVLINQMIKYYKYGFGRASDYINEEIRAGNITREEGAKIVEEYDHTCSLSTIESFCTYISITKDKFWNVIKKHMNKQLFYVDKNNNIKKKFIVGKSF